MSRFFGSSLRPYVAPELAVTRSRLACQNSTRLGQDAFRSLARLGRTPRLRLLRLDNTFFARMRNIVSTPTCLGQHSFLDHPGAWLRVTLTSGDRIPEQEMAWTI